MMLIKYHATIVAAIDSRLICYRQPQGSGLFKVEKSNARIIEITLCSKRHAIMETLGLIALVLCCSLFADNMMIRHKMKQLDERITELSASKT